MANETSFRDFFAGQRMTQIAQSDAIKRGVPRPLNAGWYSVGATKPYDDQVQYASVTWNRGNATVVQRGSLPRSVNVGNSAWKFATLLNMAEEFAIDARFMSSLSSNMPMIRANAEMELARQMIGF